MVTLLPQCFLVLAVRLVVTEAATFVIRLRTIRCEIALRRHIITVVAGSLLTIRMLILQSIFSELFFPTNCASPVSASSSSSASTSALQQAGRLVRCYCVCRGGCEMCTLVTTVAGTVPRIDMCTAISLTF
uniref:Uncharacterized protein n=1 Tax=Anopheles darlingi TaxID=43151 RepID=A0A2M4DB95_ANODA